MSHAPLLRDIDRFLVSAGMAETTFGRLAVNDGKFIGRLRSGKRCWPETEARVRAFMRSRCADQIATERQGFR